LIRALRCRAQEQAELRAPDEVHECGDRRLPAAAVSALARHRRRQRNRHRAAQPCVMALAGTAITRRPSGPRAGPRTHQRRRPPRRSRHRSPGCGCPARTVATPFSPATYSAPATPTDLRRRSPSDWPSRRARTRRGCRGCRMPTPRRRRYALPSAAELLDDAGEVRTLRRSEVPGKISRTTRTDLRLADMM